LIFSVSEKLGKEAIGQATIDKTKVTVPVFHHPGHFAGKLIYNQIFKDIRIGVGGGQKSKFSPVQGRRLT
jgi:hypothetical protein